MFSNFPVIKTLADVKAVEQLPISHYIPFNSTYEILEYAAKQFDDRLALRFLMQGTAEETSIDISYPELLIKVTQTANLFHQLGIEKNDCVSYILPNLPQTHYTIWGGEAAGIINAVNPLLEPATIANILNEAQCKILVTLAPTPYSDIYEKLQAIVHKVPSLETILLVDLEQNVEQHSPQTKALSATFPDTEIRLLNFDIEIAKQSSNKRMSRHTIEQDDIAAYFHTGGTTGTPKLAQHTHYNEICNAYMIAALFRESDHDVLLSGLPLFHVNAVLVSGLAAFVKGSTVVLLTPAGFRSPNVFINFWKIVEKYKATMFSCVPTILSALLNIPIGKSNIRSLNHVVCGAAPLSVQLFKEFQDYTNIRIIEGYGLTESTCFSSSCPATAEPRIGSIGIRSPFSYIKTVIMDDQGKYLRDCITDEMGVLALKGPSVFPGYKQQEKNTEAFLDDGWLNTGDLARIDAEGYIWLTGRAKDLIIRGGHNIDPAIIEDALMSHPAVDLVAAIGQPDAYAGELPYAYVTVKEDVTAEELQLHAKAKIAERAATPVGIDILEKMPVTAVGKIFKPELRQFAIKRVFESMLKEAKIKAEVRVDKDKKNGVVVSIKTECSQQALDAAVGMLTINFCKA